ncbi:hypothetical protein QQG55_11475 [Brugia pahangi]
MHACACICMQIKLVTVEGFIITNQKQQVQRQVSTKVTTAGTTHQQCIIPVTSSHQTICAKSISQDRTDELLGTNSSRLNNIRLVKKLDSYSFLEQISCSKNRKLKHGTK